MVTFLPKPSESLDPWKAARDAYDDSLEAGIREVESSANGLTTRVAGLEGKIGKTGNLFNVLTPNARIYDVNGLSITTGRNRAILTIAGQALNPIPATAEVSLMNGSVSGTYLSLDVTKQYTVSVKVLSGKAIDSRAITLAVQRTDTAANMSTLSIGALLLSGGVASTTFTPSFGVGRVALFLSSGLYNMGRVKLQVNISEGTSPSATLFGTTSPLVEADAVAERLSDERVYTYIVDKSGRGDYTTLTECVAAAPTGSTIFVRNGYYDGEQVEAWLKTLYITGESRHGVVITNATGEYATPPIEMGSGLLRNLTVYARKTSGVTPSTQTYALHSEAYTLKDGHFSIENCTIKSEWRQAWGMGARGGCVVEAKDTDFIGGVYFHDSDYDSALGAQKVTFKDCNITRSDTTPALLMQSQEKVGSLTTVEFVRCLVKGTTLNVRAVNWQSGTGGPDDFLGLINWRLSPFSWGNSDSQLDGVL